MRLKKNLSQLVLSDYVPLHEEYEGHLRGGFGSVIVGHATMHGSVNNDCANPECKNDLCSNTDCQNGECSNNCPMNQCSSTPSPTATNSNTNTPQNIGIVGLWG